MLFRNCVLRRCAISTQVLIRTASNDNALVLLEVLQPNKTDVLGYLNGTTGPPPRWARALVAQGATEEAFAVDYMVCNPYAEVNIGHHGWAVAVTAASFSTLPLHQQQ
jgi:Copper amine oxidase, N2 domain